MKKKIKKNRFIIFIILGVIIVIMALLIISRNNGVLNTNNSEIEKQALLWYYDHDKLYNKTTIGALYKNGYIDSNDNECVIINLDNDKAKVSNKKDCDYNNSIKDYPTIIMNLVESDTNEEYKIGTWTSSDIKINAEIKNNVIDNKDIERIYLAKDGEELDEMIISSDDNLDALYTLTVDLNNSNHYFRQFEIKIDKTKPYLEDVNGKYANFQDNESGIKEVLYHYSEVDDYVPTETSEFVELDNFKLEKDKTYYIWAIGINNVGISSDIAYVGEYKNESEEIAASGGGSASKEDN